MQEVDFWIDEEETVEKKRSECERPMPEVRWASDKPNPKRRQSVPFHTTIPAEERDAFLAWIEANRFKTQRDAIRWVLWYVMKEAPDVHKIISTD